MSRLETWENIHVTLDIAGGGPLVTRASDKMKYAFHMEECDPKHIRPFAYFDLDNDDKNKKLTLTVRYTRSAWEASKLAGDGRPRIYYRKYDTVNEIWVGNWIEIDPNIIEVIDPDKKDQFGYLIASLPNLPDPAIGGC